MNNTNNNSNSNSNSNSDSGSVIGLNGSGPLANLIATEQSSGLRARIAALRPVYNDSSHPVPQMGPLAALTVPGAVAAWCSLHDRFGRLPWRSLFKPAVKLAMHGFVMSVHTRRNWDHIERFVDAMHRGMLSAAQLHEFMDMYAPGGEGPRTGEMYRNPALGRTLSALARGGCKEFYSGSIAGM